MSISRTVFAGAAASAVLLLSHGIARAAIDAPSERVIQASARALGTDALAGVRVIHLTGTVRAAGLNGTGDLWLGIRSSQFAESATLGPIFQADGFDGKAVWNQDGTGLTWDDGSDTGRAAEIDNAYISTYALWRPDADGANVRYAGVKSSKGRDYDVLSVMPRGSKLPIDLWFDRTTHILQRTVFARGPVISTQLFSDYRRVHGALLPFVSDLETTDGNSSITRVTHVDVDAPGALAHLTRPTTTPHDFTIARGTSTTLPFDLVENHVYLNVMLNGKGPYRFIFDTGGQNLIDPAVAREIGAVGKGNAQAGGVGSQTASFSFATVRDLEVGKAHLRNQLFAVAPVRAGFGLAAGQSADGLIGWEVLARFVTEFNYANKTVTLTLPNAATPPANADVIPFVLNGTQPQIACGIDAILSQCTIDTGARDTLSMLAPYVAEHPHVLPSKLTANGVTGFGIGGPAYGKLGRLASLSIGTYTLRDLVADFSTQKGGAFAQPFVAANIGGQLLRRFDITFDYGKQTMALVPNADFGKRDFYDRSGLFLIRMKGKTVAIDVRTGTPAAKAGIAKGDALVSIDGRAVSDMSLEAVRAAFLQASGTAVHLVIADKAGVHRNVVLTLEDYV